MHTVTAGIDLTPELKGLTASAIANVVGGLAAATLGCWRRRRSTATR